MKAKIYYGIIIAVCALGVLSLAALLLYTVILQKDCSIISYIAKGR